MSSEAISSQFLGQNSGLDVQNIVNQLVELEIEKVRETDDRIETTEGQQDAFKELNDNVSSLSDSLSTLSDPSNYGQIKASSSNEDVATASITDEDAATEGTTSLKVNQLATGGTRTSGTFINSQAMYSTDDDLTSRSDFAVSQDGNLDPSTDFIDELQNDIELTGSGNEDFEIRDETSGDRIAVDLNEFMNNNDSSDVNFQSLMDAVNNFDDSLAGIETEGSAANFNVQMEFDSTTDQFVMFANDQSDDGGSDFEIRDEPSTFADIDGFFTAIGIDNGDGTLKTFNAGQSAAGENLLSIDQDASLDEALFNLNSNDSRSIDGETSGVVKINNQEVFWSADDAVSSFQDVKDQDDNGDRDFSFNPDNVDPVNADSPVRSVSDFVSTISENVDGIDASYSSATDKITLEATDESINDISVTDLGTDTDGADDGDLAQLLNLSDQSHEELQAASTTSGQDADIEIDGQSTTNPGNTVEFDGLQVDLKQAQEAGDDPIDISVSKDNSDITSAVDSFVSQFNSVQQFINEQTSVGDPSSDDSEDSDQEGPLQNTSLPRNISNTLTRAITTRYNDATPDDSPIENLFDVGIEQVDPTTASESQRGTLEFDSGKLEDALENNPEDVKKLFTADESEGDAQNGVFTRLQGQVEAFTDDRNGIITSRIEGFDDTVSRLQERREEQVERAEDKRDRLLDEFRRMEEQLLELQSQQSQFSMFGGGGGGGGGLGGLI